MELENLWVAFIMILVAFSQPQYEEVIVGIILTYGLRALLELYATSPLLNVPSLNNYFTGLSTLYILKLGMGSALDGEITWMRVRATWELSRSIDSRPQRALATSETVADAISLIPLVYVCMVMVVPAPKELEIALYCCLAMLIHNVLRDGATWLRRKRTA